MKLLLALLLLATPNAHAAKLMSQKVRSYFPAVGLGSTSSVAFTGSGASSFTWEASGGARTMLVRVFATQSAYIEVGESPTPSSADPILPANTEMILEIPTRQKVGAAAVSSNGILYVTEFLTYPNLD